MIMKRDFVRSAVLRGLLGLLAGVAVVAAAAGAEDMEAKIENFAFLLYLLIAYVAVGIVVALTFVTIGVAQVQPMSVTVGARVLLLPGAFVLWPLVVSRWLRSHGDR